jgi:hypothetical protein
LAAETRPVHINQSLVIAGDIKIQAMKDGIHTVKIYYTTETGFVFQHFTAGQSYNSFVPTKDRIGIAKLIPNWDSWPEADSQ